MDLTGRLSNHDLTTVLQRLTAHDWKQAAAPQRSRSGIAPDGRRKFGTVSDAIVQVLATADSDLRVREIQKGVEKVLGGAVSPILGEGLPTRGLPAQSTALRIPREVADTASPVTRSDAT